MLSYIDTLTVIPNTNSTTLILKIHEQLLDLGASISVGDLYYLNEYQGKELDPDTITSSKETLEKLSKWPTAGWVKYDILGGDLLISYIPQSNFLVNAITISEQRSNLELYDVTKIKTLINFFHESFHAISTYQGELLFDKINIEKEIIRTINYATFLPTEDDLQKLNFLKIEIHNKLIRSSTKKNSTPQKVKEYINNLEELKTKTTHYNKDIRLRAQWFSNQLIDYYNQIIS